ncbi:MAG: plasmid recombination protein [Ruminococcaceae bacterium]|nr:plasmid recombination protein [Oscillospiraceae bacterium]
MRFAKYKGPEIGRIEAHNERTKETYASNPDVDTSRSKQNFHLIAPQRKYRAEAEKQIAEAQCRVRSDSVRVVETLITASPDFFQGKQLPEIKAFFEDALAFIQAHQVKETIISAVVHMDEKTPHMHLSFIPLTADNRLSAKDIVGNKKKLTWWQDEFWKHMVKKYPNLERGESASETGRTHVPPRLFKEATHLNKQRELLLKLLSEINPLNARRKSAEIEQLLEQYIPGVEKMKTQLKKYSGAYKQLKAENAELEKKLDANKESVQRRLELTQKLTELEALRSTVNTLQQVLHTIPPEIIETYAIENSVRKETHTIE